MDSGSRTWPAYLGLVAGGELRRRVVRGYEILRSCSLCGHACGTDRRVDEGFCRTGVIAKIASSGPHFGEEYPVRGTHGSGTIFFSRCNLACCYCQNYDISHLGHGCEAQPEDIAGIMLSLQELGCHNINLVSPTHVVPQILGAVMIAAEAGLQIPLVYNTGGYDSLAALELLDSVVDIYLPDMKYADSRAGQVYSGVEDYPAVNQAAVVEMHRQVGDLVMDARGVATRGLLVRHLVLPEDIAGTEEVARFLAVRISANTYTNVMDQYRPCYQADRFPSIARRTTRAEWRSALDAVANAGLSRLERRRIVAH